MQMSNVNVFATGPAEESMWWEEICLKAMTLDIADFVDSSYSGGTSGGPASTPSSSRRNLRSSQSSPQTQQRKRPNPSLDDADFDTEEEEEQENHEDDGEDDVMEERGLEGLDDMATPTSRPCVDILGSSASSMLPPLSQTRRTPCASGPPGKKRKRDTITSIAKQLAEITQQNAISLANIQKQAKLAQQQNELVLAQMRAENSKERLANTEIHRSNQEWMREESRTNRELCAQNREMLQILIRKIGIEPIVALLPTSSPPPLELQGQPSSSNISNASSLSQATKGPVPLAIEGTLPIPPPLSEEVREDRQPKGDDDIAELETQIGHNLSRDASEVEPGSVDLPTEDQPTGPKPMNA